MKVPRPYNKELKALCKKHNLTTKEVAGMMNLTVRQAQNFLTDENNVSYRRCSKSLYELVKLKVEGRL